MMSFKKTGAPEKQRVFVDPFEDFEKKDKDEEVEDVEEDEEEDDD